MEHFILIGSLIVAGVFLWRKLIQGGCSGCCSPKAGPRQCSGCTAASARLNQLGRQTEHQAEP
ncbi:MAG: hypothetical protein RBR43_03595 [Desulfuromonadaceae bacterium]|nr:hypothetical protein [Desulfuromonas sp.]MDY0184951.1 hypothetical protein [Desulfuromonadaceae bacterium]